MKINVCEHDSPVTVQRFRPDFERLFDQVSERILAEAPTGFVFFNPSVTVRCEQPAEAFFKEVRRLQREWCSRSRSTFGRNAKRVSTWFTTEEEETKFDKFFTRSLLFTGVLFVDGNLVHPHEWKRWEHGDSVIQRMSARKSRQMARGKVGGGGLT